MQEIEKKNLSKSIFRPVNHYLCHVGYITRKLGPMRSYSTRPLERTIGKYSRLIKSKVNSSANSGNLIERMSIREYVKLSVDIADELNLITKKPYNDSSFIYHPSGISGYPQLWSPILKDEFDLKLSSTDSNFNLFGVSINKCIIKERLERYYETHLENSTQHTIVNHSLKVAGRAWINHTVYSSTMNRKKMSESRRGNHNIMFESKYLK